VHDEYYHPDDEARRLVNRWRAHLLLTS